VQGTLLRTTIHLVSARDWWPIALAIRRERRERFVRGQPGAPDARHLAATARRVRARLAGGATLTRAELEGLVGSRGWGAVGGMSVWLDLLRVPPAGTWERRRADTFALAEDWLGSEPTLSASDAVDLLVSRYLGAFGPASRRDVAGWAGLPVAAVVPALERLEVRHFQDEHGGRLVPRAALPDPDTRAPVRFLATWDAALLTHARRTGILPEEHRPKVFSTKRPQSVGTFLVDGAVAGSWTHEAGEVRTEPFERLDSAVRRELADEAERLALLHAPGGR